jgi:hypothetical protein
MTWMKTFMAFSVVLLVFLSTVKIFDMIIGRMFSDSIKSPNSNKISRSILLKEFAPNEDYMERPSDHYIKGTQNLEQKAYRLRTDEDGFLIGPNDLSDTIKAKKPDIIFFGGSTTECSYVEEENRFPYLVAQKIRNSNGQRIRVLNGGVSGNHSMHSLLNYLAKGLALEPSYAVLMHAINDLVSFSKTLSYWDAPSTRSILQINRKENPIFESLRSIKNFLAPHIWLKVSHVVALNVDGLSVADEWEGYRDRRISYKEIESALRKDFKASLKSFIRISRAWNVEPILMTQFNRLNENDSFVKATFEREKQSVTYDEFVELYRLSNDIVREVSEEERVFLIDLESTVKKTPDFIYDAVHLNSNGSKLVADIIVKALISRYSQHFIAL